MRESHPQSHTTLRSCGHVTNKKNIISPLSQGRRSPTWPGGNLVWESPTNKQMQHFNHAVTCQIENVITPLSQGPWPTNVARCRLRMKGPHQQKHATIQSRGYVTNKKKCYISTFNRATDATVSKVVT